jgi:hypothetical protein
MPTLHPFKINIILRYLERSSQLIIDSDGYIIWTRETQKEAVTLGDSATLNKDFMEYFKKIKNHDNHPDGGASDD